MVVLKLLILILTLNQHVACLTCPKGQKVSRHGDRCETCPKGYYQDIENTSKTCKPCTKCDSGRGSELKEECTIYTNRKCQCRESFVRWESDSSTCKCDEGFGLKGGKCEKCEKGFVSSENEPCKKWKECKSGVKINGTATSDVICDEPNSNTYITTPPTSNKITSLRSLITQGPHGGAQTQKMHTTSATTAPQVVTFTNRAHPTHPSYIGNHIGMALLVFGIAGLLVLTAVTCKLHITECCHRQKTVKPGDSLCRRPVEESCDGSQSPLKLNLEEP